MWKAAPMARFQIQFIGQQGILSEDHGEDHGDVLRQRRFEGLEIDSRAVNCQLTARGIRRSTRS